MPPQWISADKLYFIDTDGNLAQVNVDYGRISSIAGQKLQDSVTVADQFQEELERRGFDFTFQSRFDVIDVKQLIDRYQEKVIQADREKANKSFDF